MNQHRGSDRQMKTLRNPDATQVLMHDVVGASQAAPMTDALDEYSVQISRLRTALNEFEGTLEPVLLPLDPQPVGPDNPPPHGESPRHTRLLNLNLEFVRLVDGLVALQARVRP